jgi:hypothetical protein
VNKIHTQKSKQHEIKSKTVNVTKNLDGDISVNNIISFPVWKTVSWTSVISTDVRSNHFFSALDDVYRGTVY